MSDLNIKGRCRARKLALQVLYQWQVAGQPLVDIEAQFHVAKDMTKVDTDYFHDMIHGVVDNLQECDDLFKDYLDRDISALLIIEKIILRMGTYELQHRLDVPYRVVLGEAVDLAKIFGADQGYKYVNGVLDKVAKKLRTIEMQ